MILAGIRSSHSADVLVLLKEGPLSCLDVFFPVVWRRCEGHNYHFILLPHHLFHITPVGKMFSFFQQIFSMFFICLITTHSTSFCAEPAAGLFNWLHAGFLFPFFLLNLLPMILLPPDVPGRNCLIAVALF